jgi:hypothetical protein
MSCHDTRKSCAATSGGPQLQGDQMRLSKNAQNVAQSDFPLNYCITFTVEKEAQ